MFKGFFKPLSKRDAKIAAVLFGIVLLVLAGNLVKDVLSGRPFEELHSNIMLIAFFGIIEWGMVTISFSKDKPKDEETEETPQIGSGEDQEEISEEYTEGLSEEFGTDTDPEGADAGAEGGQAGADGGEGGEAG